MLSRLLADALLTVHLLFILFVMLGGLLVLKDRRWAFLHLPAALWGAAIEFKGWICPLTPLENYLRTAGGKAGYAGGFIEHYLLPVVYPPGLTPPYSMYSGQFGDWRQSVDLWPRSQTSAFPSPLSS